MKSFVQRKEVALYFGVTCDTVHNWEKKGIVKPACIINGRPRYEMQTVIDALMNLKGGKPCHK